jgi:hypothetical protein
MDGFDQHTTVKVIMATNREVGRFTLVFECSLGHFGPSPAEAW